MPRRSTGCEKCRQRKVRCDEAKPHCRRCGDYGVECPGYRPPAEKDLHFVDQTKRVVRRSDVDIPDSGSIGQAYTQPTQVKQFQWRHLFLQNGPGDSLIDVSKRHVHRTALLSTFLDLYLPRHGDKTVMSHFSYVEALPSLDLSSPLLQAVVDTVCLMEIGCLYDDERCLHEARARYVRALPMLSKELARPTSNQLPPDQILGAVTLSALSELFVAFAVGKMEAQGWRNHCYGAQHLLTARGPEILSTEFGWKLFNNIRHSALCLGVVTRKAVLFAEPRWLEATKNAAQDDPFVALYDLAVQVPGILEQFDALSGPDQIAADFVGLCREICHLRQELDHWLNEYYIKPERQQYNIVDIRDMVEFATICQDRTFQTCFSFPSVQVCTQLQRYWTSSMILDYTLLQICKRFRSSDPTYPLLRLQDFAPRTAQEIERDGYMNAINYCRSVPYCCEPESASIGRIGTFWLLIAKEYFEVGGNLIESQWCDSIFNVIGKTVQASDSLIGDASSRPLDKEAGVRRLKSPKANIHVKCAAPTPLLIQGQYRNNCTEAGSFVHNNGTCPMAGGNFNPQDTQRSLDRWEKKDISVASDKGCRMAPSLQEEASPLSEPSPEIDNYNAAFGSNYSETRGPYYDLMIDRPTAVPPTGEIFEFCDLNIKDSSYLQANDISDMRPEYSSGPPFFLPPEL